MAKLCDDWLTRCSLNPNTHLVFFYKLPANLQAWRCWQKDSGVFGQNKSSFLPGTSPCEAQVTGFWLQLLFTVLIQKRYRSDRLTPVQSANKVPLFKCRTVREVVFFFFAPAQKHLLFALIYMQLFPFPTACMLINTAQAHKSAQTPCACSKRSVYK